MELLRGLQRLCIAKNKRRNLRQTPTFEGMETASTVVSIAIMTLSTATVASLASTFASFHCSDVRPATVAAEARTRATMDYNDDEGDHCLLLRLYRPW